jgi:hypothetical protein
MPTALKVEQAHDAEQVRRDSRDVRVGQRVIRALGRPDDLLRIQVSELWERRFRVNIYVGPDIVSSRVVHSYFLETDDDGNIIKSTPRIKRQYGPPGESPVPPPSSEAVCGG